MRSAAAVFRSISGSLQKSILPAWCHLVHFTFTFLRSCCRRFIRCLRRSVFVSFQKKLLKRKCVDKRLQADELHKSPANKKKITNLKKALTVDNYSFTFVFFWRFAPKLVAEFLTSLNILVGVVDWQCILWACNCQNHKQEWSVCRFYLNCYI